jgi:hypothetical protein
MIFIEIDEAVVNRDKNSKGKKVSRDRAIALMA